MKRRMGILLPVFSLLLTVPASAAGVADNTQSIMETVFRTIVTIATVAAVLGAAVQGYQFFLSDRAAQQAAARLKAIAAAYAAVLLLSSVILFGVSAGKRSRWTGSGSGEAVVPPREASAGMESAARDAAGTLWAGGQETEDAADSSGAGWGGGGAAGTGGAGRN